MRAIGLISGTSVDGIDAAMIDVAGTGYDLTLTFLHGLTYPYPEALRQQILQVCAGGTISLQELSYLDDAIAHAFAMAARQLMAQVGDADLIASHGQTVFHRPAVASRPVAKPDTSDQPDYQLGYSVQLGRGATIAQQLGIPVISDFRQADIAAGGQGAPLVPIVDLCLLSSPYEKRCVQNIGGIGNVAFLPPWDRQTSPPPNILGWDTGPGNSLLDIAVTSLSQGRLTYDENGAWAAQGTPCQSLVAAWLEDDYFTQPPPKSTGRELFGWQFFQQCQQMATQQGISEADLLATLTEFTAASIADAYQRFLPSMPDQVLVCGGGSHNPFLMQRLQNHLGSIPVTTTDTHGVSATFKEAIAFAVLGFWRWHDFPGNLPTVTGARTRVPLGEVTVPPSLIRNVKG
jgi:anhydro-N-acetylmuramic acid kinase